MILVLSLQIFVGTSLIFYYKTSEIMQSFSINVVFLTKKANIYVLFFLIIFYLLNCILYFVLNYMNYDCYKKFSRYDHLGFSFIFNDPLPYCNLSSKTVFYVAKYETVRFLLFIIFYDKLEFKPVYHAIWDFSIGFIYSV